MPNFVFGMEIKRQKTLAIFGLEIVGVQKEARRAFGLETHQNSILEQGFQVREVVFNCFNS